MVLTVLDNRVFEMMDKVDKKQEATTTLPDLPRDRRLHSKERSHQADVRSEEERNQAKSKGQS
jgi:hypothetical protein